MKNTTLLLLLLAFTVPASAQPLHIGDDASRLPIPPSINQGHTPGTIADLRGKIVIIDFWATWCGPCIPALEKLETFQKQLGNRLQVLAVSHETRERLKLFLKTKPSTLGIISDTARYLATWFPHRIIPHTVVIGKDGKVAAITSADNITPAVLEQLARDGAISLPEKKDNFLFNMDAYFASDTSQPYRFALLSPVSGTGTLLNRPIAGPFKNRRISILNMTIEGLFRIAYNKTQYLTVNEYDAPTGTKEKLSLDVWTPSEAGLFPFLQKQLAAQFADIEAVLERRTMKTCILRSVPGAAAKLAPSEKITDRYTASSANFSGDGVTLATFADYMESFGLFGGKVMDETGLTGRYRLLLNWQPERPGSFREALQQIGLYTTLEEREVEVLVLRKKS